MLKKIFVFQLFLIHLCSATKNSSDYLRRKRFVKYPKGSAVGYIVALAIPTEDIVNNVFVAFNFEANFILPDFETGVSSYAPKYDVVKRASEIHSNEIDIYSRIKETFTRRNIYAALEAQLFQFGLNGTACLLRTICETAEIPMYEYNGVVGNLIHITFTPSSSKNEKLPNEIHEAELRGGSNQCDAYHVDCPKSILGIFAPIITKFN